MRLARGPREPTLAMETLTRLPRQRNGQRVAGHQQKWPRVVVSQWHYFGMRADIMRNHLVWLSIGALTHTAMVATVGAGIGNYME